MDISAERLIGLSEGRESPQNGQEMHFVKVCEGTALPSSPTEAEWLRMVMERPSFLKQRSDDTAPESPADKFQEMPKAKNHPGDICVKALPSTGTQFVLDPSIVHPSEEFTYVFSIRTGEIREYEAGRIAFLKDVSDQERKHCLGLYSEWKKGNYSVFLDSVRQNEERIRKAAQERSEKTAAERKRAEDAKKSYRATVCHSCKTPLDNVRGKICSRCGGIKCICGSCLCDR